MLEMGFREAARVFQARNDVCAILQSLVPYAAFLTHAIHVLPNSYSYVATLPLLVIFSVAMCILKFREGALILFALFS